MITVSDTTALGPVTERWDDEPSASVSMTAEEGTSRQANSD